MMVKLSLRHSTSTVFDMVVVYWRSLLLWLILILAAEATAFLQPPRSWRHQVIVSFATPTSWSDLERQILPSATSSSSSAFDDAPLPVNIDSVFQPAKPAVSDNPILFRERHGWCPYSERVWWALELAGVDYDTVRIDNTGHGPKPSYWSGTTPQLRWPQTDRNQGESMDLVYAIDERYHQMGLQSDESRVRDCVARMRDTFPRRARPSSRAAFLFQNNGDPLGRSVFEETLAQTNAMLLQRRWWTLFVRRRADRGRRGLGALSRAVPVPAAGPARGAAARIDPNGRPSNGGTPPSTGCRRTRVASRATPAAGARCSPWPALATRVPCHRRFATTWWPCRRPRRKRFGRHPMCWMSDDDDKQATELQLWNEYRDQGRRASYLAATPSSEAARILAHNREPILQDTVKRVAD